MFGISLFSDNKKVLKEYCKTIDNLDDHMVKWQLYEGKMDFLPSVCKAKSELWTTQGPLIHFWIVEIYNPHRVLRQFNIRQVIPPHIHDTDEDLHAEKNGYGENWPRIHSTYLGTSIHIKIHPMIHPCMMITCNGFLELSGCNFFKHQPGELKLGPRIAMRRDRQGPTEQKERDCENESWTDVIAPNVLGSRLDVSYFCFF